MLQEVAEPNTAVTKQLVCGASRIEMIDEKHEDRLNVCDNCAQ